jgi:hypothetical protein
MYKIRFSVPGRVIASCGGFIRVTTHAYVPAKHVLLFTATSHELDVRFFGD